LDNLRGCPAHDRFGEEHGTVPQQVLVQLDTVAQVVADDRSDGVARACSFDYVLSRLEAC
jgi:hypothetical protein